MRRAGTRGGWHWAVLGAVVLAPCLVSTVAEAQSARKQAPAGGEAQAEPSASDGALKAYDAGVRAWQSGKAEQANQHLSTAISGGKLPPQQMAKALYFRGLAHRRLGKPAMAISDLQSALWLKGGLNDAERAEALAARSAAYKEAGIADPQAGQASQSAAAIGSAPPVPASAPEPARARAPATAAAQKKAEEPPVQQPRIAEPQRESDTSGIWRAPVAQRPGTITASPAPAPAPAPTVAAASPTAKTAAPQVSAWATRSVPAPVPPAPEAKPMVVATAPVTTPATPPPTRTGAVPAAPPPPPARSAAPAATGTIGTAYVPAPVPAPIPAATPPVAKVEAPAAEAPQQRRTANAGSGSGSVFSNLFGGDMPAAPPMPERRTPPPPRVDEDPDAGKAPDWSMTGAPPPGARETHKPLPKVQYRLQVGSAPTRQEAEKIANRLKTEQKKAFANQAVDVDQSGGSNPVWRVRVGPYLSANEPRNLCVRLRQSGYDCLVVMQ